MDAMVNDRYGSGIGVQYLTPAVHPLSTDREEADSNMFHSYGSSN